MAAGEIITSAESQTRKKKAEAEAKSSKEKKEANKVKRLQDQHQRWETRVDEVFECFKWSVEVIFNLFLFYRFII